MQDRICQVDETSCNARPDHTNGSQAAELAPGCELPVCPLEPTCTGAGSTEAMGQKPCKANESGGSASLDDAKAQFQEVWQGIRAGLTEADIARAKGYAERSAEAMARYRRKGPAGTR